MVSSVDFYEDYMADRKNMKKLHNLETVFFVDAVLSPEDYDKYLHLLQGRVNFANKRTFREHNVVVFMPKGSYAKVQARLKSSNNF